MTAFSLRQPASRLFAMFLALMLFALSAPTLASAQETVTGIELEPVPTPISLYVEDGAVSLTLWAYIQGSAAPKNVTADAAWSSSSSCIKVDKGVLTATGPVSSATITARYAGFTATASVKADYRFAGLKLENPDGTDAPEKLELELGNDLTLQAAALEHDGSETPVTGSAQWMTSNSSVATVSNGAVTLTGAGTVTITAKHKGRSDAIQLIVSSPYKSLEISHAVLDDTVDLMIGDPDYPLAATAVLKNTTAAVDITSDAVWTSSNNGVVKVEDGVVTPAGPGTAVVTAARYGVSDSVTFYVRTPYEALNVTTAKPLHMTLYSGRIEANASALKGTASPSDVTQDAEWKIGDPMVASVEKTAGKVYIVPKTAGSTKLTVTYKGLSRELPVSVYPSILEVAISQEEADLFEGETGALPGVKGKTASGDEIDISKLAAWKSSDESILTVEEGKWKAKKPGTAILTAEVQNEPSSAPRTDAIQVRVHKNVLALASDTSSMSVVIGKETALPGVRLIYTDGEEKDVTGEIEWKSSSPNLYVKNGKIKGLLPAGVTLTGYYLNLKMMIKVQIEEEIVSFDIQPKALNLTLNRTQSIKVTGTTKSGKKVNLGSRIEWAATSKDIVQINRSSIKGQAVGSGKLTASIQGKTLEVPFTVKARLTKLTASDTSLNLSPGKSGTVKVTAAYENGETQDVTAAAAWSSTHSSVASVAKGTIKAAGKGTTTIKAIYEGKMVTIRVYVK